MHKRQITIDKKIWHWFVGRSNVVIWGPEEQKYVVSKCDLVGWTAYETERTSHKHSFHITPSIIAGYINGVKS